MAPLEPIERFWRGVCESRWEGEERFGAVGQVVWEIWERGDWDGFGDVDCRGRDEGEGCLG